MSFTASLPRPVRENQLGVSPVTFCPLLLRDLVLAQVEVIGNHHFLVARPAAATAQPRLAFRHQDELHAETVLERDRRQRLGGSAAVVAPGRWVRRGSGLFRSRWIRVFLWGGVGDASSSSRATSFESTIETVTVFFSPFLIVKLLVMVSRPAQVIVSSWSPGIDLDRLLYPDP